MVKITATGNRVSWRSQDIEALARATDDALALIPSGKRRACDVKRLEALQRKLDDAIDEVGAAFVRLNYLSPKDRRIWTKTFGWSWIVDGLSIFHCLMLYCLPKSVRECSWPIETKTWLASGRCDGQPWETRCCGQMAWIPRASSEGFPEPGWHDLVINIFGQKVQLFWC